MTSSMELRTAETLNTDVRDSVMVVVHDTLTITKTITIRENEQGDTLRLTQVTDRDRSRSTVDVRRKKEEVRIEHDTVYVEKRDSVAVREGMDISRRTSSVSNLLKWIFRILVCVIVLVIVIKLNRFIKFLK